MLRETSYMAFNNAEWIRGWCTETMYVEEIPPFHFTFHVPTQVSSQVHAHCSVISPWVAGYIKVGPPTGEREHFISRRHVHLYPHCPAGGCWACQPWGGGKESRTGACTWVETTRAVHTWDTLESCQQNHLNELRWILTWSFLISSSTKKWHHLHFQRMYCLMVFLLVWWNHNNSLYSPLFFKWVITILGFVCSSWVSLPIKV